MSEDVRRIAAVRSGDVESFQLLLGPLVDPACALAFAMLGDWQEAEDAVQESALRAWRAAVRLREDTASFRAWFMTIVANECRSRRRTRWFRLIRVADARTSDPVDVADRASEATDIDRALAVLDEQSRLALLAHFYLDLPFEATAKVLGVSTAAAKTRVYRAARSLRPSLELELL